MGIFEKLRNKFAPNAVEKPAAVSPEITNQRSGFWGRVKNTLLGPAVAASTLALAAGCNDQPVSTPDVSPAPQPAVTASASAKTMNSVPAGAATEQAEQKEVQGQEYTLNLSSPAMARFLSRFQGEEFFNDLNKVAKDFRIALSEKEAKMLESNSAMEVRLKILAEIVNTAKKTLDPGVDANNKPKPGSIAYRFFKSMNDTEVYSPHKGRMSELDYFIRMMSGLENEGNGQFTGLKNLLPAIGPGIVTPLEKIPQSESTILHLNFEGEEGKARKAQYNDHLDKITGSKEKNYVPKYGPLASTPIAEALYQAAVDLQNNPIDQATFGENGKEKEDKKGNLELRSKFAVFMDRVSQKLLDINDVKMREQLRKDLQRRFEVMENDPVRKILDLLERDNSHKRTKEEIDTDRFGEEFEKKLEEEKKKSRGAAPAPISPAPADTTGFLIPQPGEFMTVPASTFASVGAPKNETLEAPAVEKTNAAPKLPTTAAERLAKLKEIEERVKANSAKAEAAKAAKAQKRVASQMAELEAKMAAERISPAKVTLPTKITAPDPTLAKIDADWDFIEEKMDLARIDAGWDSLQESSAVTTSTIEKAEKAAA